MTRFHKLAQLILCLCAVCFLSACIKHIEPGIILYPTPHDDFVKIDTDVLGVQIHYRKYPGEGGNVVLIHGFASSTYTWEDMVPELQGKFKSSGKPCPRVWAVDMKGFGWSDKPKDSKYDPFTLAGEVYTWMNAVGIDKATLVGNSLGGAIAWVIALDHPEKVAQLVLVDAGGYPLIKGNYKEFAHTPFLQVGIKALFSRSAVKMVLHKTFYDSGKVTDSRVAAYYNRLRTAGALDALVLMNKNFDPEQVRSYVERIPDIRQKTLIIWGEQDIWVPLKFSNQFNQDIKRSTLAVIPQCGHMPQEEKPGVVAGELYRFLTENPQLPAK
jgi:pimeloyl-ACP methyl ester carboxylesterase